MKTNVNFYAFRDAFHTYDRQGNFPDGGLSVLFDYLEQLEEDIGQEIELDVIALCCDYSQMTFDDLAREYSMDVDYGEAMDEDERLEALKEAVIEYLEDNTSVVGEVGDDSIIFACF